MRLFISYSHRDKDLAEALQKVLEAQSHKVSRDVDFMRGGARWRDQIEAIIRNHDAVIYALSADSLTSPECRDEIEKANKHRKPIVHIKIKECVLPKAVEQYHVLDATGGFTASVTAQIQSSLAAIAAKRLRKRVLTGLVAISIIAIIGVLGLLAARNGLPVALQATLGLVTFTPTPTATPTFTSTATATFTPSATPTATLTPLATANVDKREVLLIYTDLDRRAGCPLDLEQTVETKIKLAVEQIREQNGVNARFARVRQVIADKDQARQLATDRKATIVVWGLCNGNVFVQLNYTLAPQWSDIRNVTASSAFRTDSQSQSSFSALEQLSSTILGQTEIDYLLNFVLAQLAYFGETPESALTYLNAALALAPLDEAQAKKMQVNSVYFYRGYINQVILNKLEQAIKDYDAVLRLNPEAFVAYNNRGTAKSDLEDYAGAIEDFDVALQLSPTYHFAYNNRGTAKKDLKDYVGAIKDYDEAIRLNPQYAEAYNNRGVVKRTLNDYDGALKDYDKAIRLNSQSAMYHINRGILKRTLKDYAGAIKDCDEAIRLNPQYANAYLVRGTAKSDLKDYAGAIKDYDEAIRLNPEFIDAYLVRGIVYALTGNYRQAETDLKEAIRLAPNDAEAYVTLGIVYSLQDRYSDELAVYNAYLSLVSDPDPRIVEAKKMAEATLAALNSVPTNTPFVFPTAPPYKTRVPNATATP